MERRKHMGKTIAPRMKDIISLGAVLLILGGCASATVKPLKKAAGTLPRPDVVIINDFAVKSADVKLDQGMMAKVMRDSDSKSVSEEEDKIGRVVADKLSEFLVEELRAKGIPATRAGSTVKSSATTLTLTGQFITIDKGNQTARVWVGFGMGGSELSTRMQAWQGGKMVAEAETTTQSSLKPGMLTSLGVGAAATSVAPLVVGGVTTGLSETVRGTIEADARRTAKEVAKRVETAYRDRGWLQ